MTDDPTAWEDINPPMASAPRQELQSLSSELLTPATTDAFRNELTACLTLVAPVGMTEEAKRDWLAVAWGTLKHLPSDLLSDGCRVARETCDHPSKIVPVIVEATSEELERRSTTRRADPWISLAGPPPRRNVMEHRGKPMSEEETAELNGMLERLGAIARYRMDGSRYTVEK
jgi:hypothetical protein